MPAADTHTSSKFLKALATIVSYVLHPLFMPVYMALALYTLAPVSFTGISHQQFHQWLGIIALSTIFFPLVAVLLMKGLGFIKSIFMHDTRERIIPLMATMIFYFWVSHVFNSVGQSDKHIVVPMVMRVLLLGSFWAVIAVFMFNIFVKISMHTTGAGCMVGIFMVLMLSSPANMMLPFLVAVAIAGVIGTARMILGSHTIAEIWLGYIVGILVMLGAYWYL